MHELSATSDVNKSLSSGTLALIISLAAQFTSVLTVWIRTSEIVSYRPTTSIDYIRACVVNFTGTCLETGTITPDLPAKNWRDVNINLLTRWRHTHDDVTRVASTYFFYPCNLFLSKFMDTDNKCTFIVREPYLSYFRIVI